MKWIKMQRTRSMIAVAAGLTALVAGVVSASSGAASVAMPRTARGDVLSFSDHGAPVQPESEPLLPPANGPRKADPTWHALINATVYPAPGKKIENATIVMRNGRILSIEGTSVEMQPGDFAGAASGTKKNDPEKSKDEKQATSVPEASSPPAPAGARVWDCRGLTVYAGWIDPFVEVDAPAPAPDSPGLHWNAAVTPQRSALDGSGVDGGTAESLRRLGFVAAGISPRGGLFRGSAAVVSLAKPEEDRQHRRPWVFADSPYQTVGFTAGGGRRGGGDDAGNTNSNWSGYPNSQMGAIALIRQTLIDADWWASASATQDAAGTSDVPSCLDALAPRTDTNAGTRLLFVTDDELETFRAVKIAKEFNRNAAVVGCGTEFRRLDGIAQVCAGQVPMIVPLNFPDAPKVSTLGQADAVELRDLMTWEQAPTNPRRLEAAGVQVSLTTSKLRDRGKFTEQLRKAVLHGLSESAAMEMVTTRPAALLGVSKELGTIEVGKAASLVVADGPLLGKKTKIRDVWVDGKRHEISPAPTTKLTGEWEVTLNPMPKPADGVASIRLTLSIDKDNNITIRKYVTKDDGTEEVAKVTPRNVRVEGTGGSGRISYVFDHEPFGEPGVYMSAGVIEDGGNTIHADASRANGMRFKWSAKKIADQPVSDADAAPKGFAGTWLYSEVDGVAVPPAAGEAGEVPTILIDKDHNLTVKLRDKEVKADSVKVEGRAITIVINGEPFGEAGMLNSTGRLEGDTIVGETIFPGGRKEAWKLTREKKPDPASSSAAKHDAAPNPAKHADPTDPVTGTWSGSAKAEGMPQALPVSFTFKLEGDVVSGTSTAMGDTRPISGGNFEKTAENSGKVKFTVSPPEGLPITITLDLTGDSATGGGQAGPAKLSINLTRASGQAQASGDDDDEAPKDIPEKITYPFGPYAMADGVPAPENVLFINATIWTSGPQGVINGGYILIENGTIKAIGPGKMDAAAGTRVIDCAGKHITPGLIDCHSHTGISRGVNESGQAVTAEVRIQDVTDPDSMSWYWQLAGGITTVNNLHGSANPIGGQNCVNKNRWGALKPDDLHFEGAIAGIKFALGENVKQSNWGDGATTRYPKTRMGVDTLIRDRFTAAREYRTQLNAELAANLPSHAAPTDKQETFGVRRDLELEALAEILAGQRLIHCHSYRQDEILALCRVASEFGFKLGTFQHILEGYKVAEEVRDHSIGPSAFSDWWAYKVEVQDAIPYAGAIMHDVGAVVSFNSDSDELARRMNVEAGKAVKYGNIDPAEALKFVTLNPAKQLKIDDKVGSLEVGKVADLVVWSVPSGTPSLREGSSQMVRPHTVDGTPLSVFARCEQTWIDGRLYFSAERDAAMRETNAKERSRLLQKLLSTGTKKSGPDAKPGESGSGTPGAPRGGRRRPTDSLTAGTEALDDSDGWEQFDNGVDEVVRSRMSLMQRMHQQAADAKREHYLHLWRRGIDPTWARCGDCGEAFGTR